MVKLIIADQNPAVEQAISKLKPWLVKATKTWFRVEDNAYTTYELLLELSDWEQFKAITQAWTVYHQYYDNDIIVMHVSKV